MTFVTCASAPPGSATAAEPLLQALLLLLRKDVEADVHVPHALEAANGSITPFWKCERIGQPGVVSDTTTSTRPASWISIERTIPRRRCLAQLRIDDGLERFGDLVLRRHHYRAYGTSRTPAGARGPRRLREERCCTDRALSPNSFAPVPTLSSGRSGVSPLPRPVGDLILDALGQALRIRLQILGGALELATVALHRTGDGGATLTHLALDARARLLDLTLDALLGALATTLELLEVGCDLLLQALELLLGALATVDVRLGRIDHDVARLEGGAHRDQKGTLGLGLNDLKGVQWPRRGSRLLCGGRAALGGVAPPCLQQPSGRSPCAVLRSE